MISWVVLVVTVRVEGLLERWILWLLVVVSIEGVVIAAAARLSVAKVASMLAMMAAIISTVANCVFLIQSTISQGQVR